MTYAACLDWSRHEDIQTGTVRGRLSWTGRRYRAGTVRGRPIWFSSLLPECREHQAGSPAWSRSNTKIKRRLFRRAEFKCREMMCRTAQAQIKCSVQMWCLSAEPYTRAGIPRLIILVHICYTLTGILYPPLGAPPAGSKPRPAEKPRKPGNNTRATNTSPRGTSGSNPSTESSNKQHKENTDKYANDMQGIKAKTESREPKDLNNNSTTRSDQRNNQFVATGILSTWELPTHLQYNIPDANKHLHLLLLAHEMWELPTPLIAANKPSRENEVWELPAQPPRYTGTTRSPLNIASWYSQFNRTGIVSKIGLESNMRVCNATTDIITQAQATITTSRLHNDADPPPAQRQHNNCSKTEAQKSNSRELQLNLRYPTSSNTTESSNKLKVFQDLQLVEVLIQLAVPQEVVRVSQLCIVFICTGITAGGMSRVMHSLI
ncbi:hypothetical protein F511_10945 [Dorcoceras hygrometricum]|uniref:Uncharacterized protein n=1 Tax=Dorcoceras hygrometricum TaxID=472368 RepID=A0A2Z7BK46_9LAMI|nr:hypothetical protein F511_10945 [Dorcoceras hygrometricum]